mmetsp:Transcript_8047/g.11674  ORF Transcript_8047/g.11674 Transcript_8047/m.11674 type:complete len:472 (-) Transcript_8047:11-1426(-)
MSPKDMSKDSNAASKLGRKGDPRMHRAVAARLANPELSLLDALREGGFGIPMNGNSDTMVVDFDGVTLGQRKNQLSRRLRLAKQSLPHKYDPGNDICATGLKRVAKRGAEEIQDVNNDTNVGMSRPRLYPIGISGAGHAHSVNAAQASSVAMASLISTASSIGMTLEQLAIRLANTPTLFQSLSSDPDPEAKLNLALSLYQVDSRALLQKCMILAGYEGTEITEGSTSYMQVALNIWEQEGKRIETLLGTGNHKRIEDFCECLVRESQQLGVSGTQESTASRATNPSQRKHSHYPINLDSAHSHDHGLNKQVGGIRQEQKEGEKEGLVHQTEGRHVHRLSGRCGHKAIIHQPPGRPAHIDFVVDGKIECYEGIKPVGPRGQGALWPSRHKCIDLACPTDPQKSWLACGSNHNALEVDQLEVQNAQPKQLSLTDVDFDGKEWNVDFFSHDGQDDTLLGLIKLGDGDNKQDDA